MLNGVCNFNDIAYPLCRLKLFASHCISWKQHWSTCCLRVWTVTHTLH